MEDFWKVCCNRGDDQIAGHHPSTHDFTTIPLAQATWGSTLAFEDGKPLEVLVEPWLGCRAERASLAQTLPS